MQKKRCRNVWLNFRQTRTPGEDVGPVSTIASTIGPATASTIGPGDDLTLRLQEHFELLIPGQDDVEIDEDELYDVFMLGQEEHQREQVLNQMFASCHNGQPLPVKELKRFRSKPKARSCRDSFSACLRAIGGVVCKRDKRNVWLNFRLKYK